MPRITAGGSVSINWASVLAIEQHGEAEKGGFKGRTSRISVAPQDWEGIWPHVSVCL